MGIASALFFSIYLIELDVDLLWIGLLGLQIIILELHRIWACSAFPLCPLARPWSSISLHGEFRASEATFSNSAKSKLRSGRSSRG